MNRLTLLLLGVAATLGGCANAARPVFYNGQYYMAGDPDCVNARPLNNISIMCGDKNFRETGARYSLTPAEVQQYQIQQAEAQAQVRQLADQITAVGNDLAAQQRESAAAYNAATRALPTTAQPIGPQQQQIWCLVNGRYVACRTR